jgi:hypothetical protein
MNKSKAVLLDKFIEKMKAMFPYFNYVNILKTKGEKYTLGDDAFAIVVESIKNNEVSAFLKFVDDEILLPLIENCMELPLVITLQGSNQEVQWQECCQNMVEDSGFGEGGLVQGIAAEDYLYQLAA